MIDRYSWSGGTEQILSLGSALATQIIIVPPLFEEANRLRKTLVDVLRGLHAAGFGVTLPDLPAMGESLEPYQDTSFDDWCAALSDAVTVRRNAGQTVVIGAFRGGGLIAPLVECEGVWRLAPESGARLLRDLSRAVLARNASTQRDEIYDHAGYPLPRGLVAALEAASPPPARNLRTVRLLKDTNDYDARIAGSPLWRRSEPGDDPALTKAIIDDLSAWAYRCATA